MIFWCKFIIRSIHNSPSYKEDFTSSLEDNTIKTFNLNDGFTKIKYFEQTNSTHKIENFELTLLAIKLKSQTAIEITKSDHEHESVPTSFFDSESSNSDASLFGVHADLSKFMFYLNNYEKNPEKLQDLELEDFLLVSRCHGGSGNKSVEIRTDRVKVVC